MASSSPVEIRAMAPAPLLTTDEYLRTPETLQPTEVIYGALRVAGAPTVRHQQALCAFLVALALHVRERRLGIVLVSPLDIIFDYERALILQPDLVFISNGRRTILRQERVIGAPDMVLEVLSPHPRIGNLQERIDWFVQYGVREIWLLHQLREQFEMLIVQDGRVARRDVSDYLTPIRSDVLPEFTMTVGDILRE
ncbi:MAG TPA: Uma2 family endonuclease [Vicinamibacterales bacterium]